MRTVAAHLSSCYTYVGVEFYLTSGLLNLAKRQQQQLMGSPHAFAFPGIDIFKLLKDVLIIHEAKDIKCCWEKRNFRIVRQDGFSGDSVRIPAWESQY
nr:hypothetical protein [Nafulsella turpanensis]